MQSDKAKLIVETGSEPVASVIWAHGLGADGHDFEPVVPMLGIPGDIPVRFIFPHAPVRPITINGGMHMRGWYDIRSMAINEQEDEAGIRQSAAILSALIDEQLALGIPASRVVLAGFSQGGAIALFQGLRDSRPLAGILALSTYLPLPSRLDAEAAASMTDVPVFMGHGTQDPIVPLDLGRFTSDFLKQRGVSVDFRQYPMGHSVSDREIADVGQWLSARLAVKK
jgi:phospholipase/carboxylesterase